MTPWVQRLLIANVGLFLAQYTIPGVTEALIYVPRLILVRPWTVITYMFLHGGITHLLFNMLALFFFGPRVEERIGSRRFLTLYLLSGISGAVLSLFFTPNAMILGASGATFGVGLAFAMFWPREQILIWGIIPVEARVLVLITTAIALYSGVTGSGGGVAHFAHLGGYAGAYLYLVYLDRTSGAKQFRRKVAAPDPKVEKQLSTNWKNVKLDGVHDLTKEEVNRILDKISAEGIGSLTAQEKLFLSNFVPLDDRKPVS